MNTEGFDSASALVTLLACCWRQDATISRMQAVYCLAHSSLAFLACHAGLQWQGRAHSGLDDAMNTARLAIKLLRQGTLFEVTQISENVPVKQPQGQVGADSQVPASSVPTSTGSKQNRTSMQALAAANGVSGIFDSAGKWSGNCFCMLKAHFRTTKRPGPNHGRQFYACGRWTITQQSKQCAFFLWKEDVPSGSTSRAT